jgi:hypothetical protein
MENKNVGELEELVLLAVCILEGEASGISVEKEVENIQEGQYFRGQCTSRFIACRTKDLFNPKWVEILKNGATGESNCLKSPKQERGNYVQPEVFVRKCGT